MGGAGRQATKKVSEPSELPTSPCPCPPINASSLTPETKTKVGDKACVVGTGNRHGVGTSGQGHDKAQKKATRHGGKNKA